MGQVTIRRCGCSDFATLRNHTFKYQTYIQLENLNIGDKGVEKLSQLLQDSVFLESLSPGNSHVSDNGASAIADLMKALSPLQLVYLDANHIGGRGAALL